MHKSACLRDLTIFSCLTLPMLAFWQVQKGAMEKSRQPVSTAGVPVREMAANSGSPGLPFLHLSVQDVSAAQAVNTFSSLVNRQARELGPDSADTLVSRNNLANALMAEGRYIEAEAAQRALLKDMERTFDRAHPDVFRCRFNLALNLRKQGKKDEARQEMEIVYEGWRSVLGEDHPRTQIARIVLDDLHPPKTVSLQH